MRSSGAEAVDDGQCLVNGRSVTLSTGAGRTVLPSPQRPVTEIEFRLLGAFEVVVDNRPLPLGSPRQRALLAVLVLHRGEAVSPDRLIDALWSGRAPPTARKIVQGYISSLRKVLGDGLLVSGGSGYVLDIAPDHIDSGRFESLAAAGRRRLMENDPGAAAKLLREALALWRGPPLADFAYDAFAQAESTRLEETRLTALEDRIEAELSLGRQTELVAELEALVGEHPMRERFIGQLMVALYRSGRQADALEYYRSARARLIEELGLEPSRGLRELELAILEQDPGLEPTGRPPPTDRAPTAGLYQVGRRRKLRVPAIAAGVVVLLAAVAALVTLTASGSSRGMRASPNSLAAIDVHSNRVTGVAPVGEGPQALGFGAGSLWVANVDDETVSRVDPRTLQTLATVALSAAPTGIAATPTGVWVATTGPTATFVSASRIDPQFDVTDRAVRVDDVVPGSGAALAAAGSKLWVAPSSGELTAVDPMTGRVTRRLDPNSAPQAIALGYGATWITDNEGDNVVRVDPSGVITPIPVGHSPDGIAVGAGAVWVADTGDDALVRIDPGTNSVTTTIPVGLEPTGVAVGAGSVWVANSGDGTVTRIDPLTDKPIATISVGGSPRQITVARGHAWITVDAQTVPPAGRTAGTLRVVLPYDFGPLDPALTDDPGSSMVLYATCAKLLNYPDRAGAGGSVVVPEVAQSLPRRSAGGRTYTFTIRRGFRFAPPSNAPVTAETFKYSIDRALNPRMRSPSAADFRDIVGAAAYEAGRSPHLAGVVADGDQLRIRLVAPAPDFLARVTEPAFCAVPTDTPIDPRGVRTLPSAGPYSVTSYTPGQGAVLTRNPNYAGKRPHRMARIEVSFVGSINHAIAEVRADNADYATGDSFTAVQAKALLARYGPRSAAARQGHQQFFVTPYPQLDFLVLNTHRPLFADTRLRRAVSYAIDRAALARLGDFFLPLPERETDLYLPPGMPGYRDVRVYPPTPDLAAAKRLARGHRGAKVVLYTCEAKPCPQQAQIIKRNLAVIGLRVEIKLMSSARLFAEAPKRGAPYDMTWSGWIPDYLDPDAMLDVLLEQGTVEPTFVSPIWRARLRAAARLTGPKRYLNYARLDAELVRDAAPLVAFGNGSSLDFFSARIGCQVFTPAYGIDLAALCVRRARSR